MLVSVDMLEVAVVLMRAWCATGLIDQSTFGYSRRMKMRRWILLVKLYESKSNYDTTNSGPVNTLLSIQAHAPAPQIHGLEAGKSHVERGEDASQSRASSRHVRTDVLQT
jgi:hypothetical protein